MKNHIAKFLPFLLLASIAIFGSGYRDLTKVLYDDTGIVLPDSGVLTFGKDADVTLTHSGTSVAVSGSVSFVGSKLNTISNTASSRTLAATESGSLIIDATSGASTINLPTPTSGMYFKVANISGTTHVEPGAGVQIIGLTNTAADKITTASAGATLEVWGISATQWVALCEHDQWADGE